MAGDDGGRFAQLADQEHHQRHRRGSRRQDQGAVPARRTAAGRGRRAGRHVQGARPDRALSAPDAADRAWRGDGDLRCEDIQGQDPGRRCRQHQARHRRPADHRSGCRGSVHQGRRRHHQPDAGCAEAARPRAPGLHLQARPVAGALVRRRRDPYPVRLPRREGPDLRPGGYRRHRRHEECRPAEGDVRAGRDRGKPGPGAEPERHAHQRAAQVRRHPARPAVAREFLRQAAVRAADPRHRRRRMPSSAPPSATTRGRSSTGLPTPTSPTSAIRTGGGASTRPST